MKSFIFKITLFIFIWIIIYSVLFILIPRKFYSRDDYEVFMAVSNKRKSGGIHGNILIGDSKPLMGINAKAIHATNFALSAETPIEGFYEIRQLISNKTNHIDTVFVSYTHKHLITQECLYHYTYYYGFIDSKYLDSARQVAAQYNDNNYSLRSGSFSKLDQLFKSPVLIEKKKIISEFITGGFNTIFEHLQKMVNGKTVNGNNQFINGRLIVLPSDTVKFIRPNETAIVDEELADVHASEVNMIYFKKILAFCAANKVHVMFIETPSVRAKSSILLRKHLAGLRTLFGNDFLQDTSVYSDAYFRDGYGHLNKYGAARFATFLNKTLYRSRN